MRVKNHVSDNVPGLSFITALRPVTFHYDIQKENELMGIIDTSKWTGKYDIEKITFSGFIAQEVESAADAINYDFSGLDKSGDIMALRYAEFVVPLVKAVQEQQALITKLESRIAALEEANAGIVKSSGSKKVKRL
jgi:hypothetical protein